MNVLAYSIIEFLALILGLSVGLFSRLQGIITIEICIIYGTLSVKFSKSIGLICQGTELYQWYVYQGS